MTDIRNDNRTLIASVEDAIPLYKGNGLPPDRQTIGFETEICLYRPDTCALAPAEDCARLMRNLAARGHAPQLEMSSTLEYASPAVPLSDLPRLMEKSTRDLQDYDAVLRRAGYAPSDGALLPFVTMDVAEACLVDRERARGLVKGMKRFKDPAFLKVTLLCTSTQVSLSYADTEDLHNILRTGYALQAPIIALFANHPARIEDQSTPINRHPRAALYDAFGPEGGIPDSLLSAKDGDGFVRAHTRQVMTTPLLYHYDRNGNMTWPDRPLTFADLADRGLNTRSNYDLAESFLYHDIKVCNIRDAQGHPTGKRIEFRGFDSGRPGVSTAAPFVRAVLRDPATRTNVEDLLASYGLDPQEEAFGVRLKAARHAAAFHGGKYMDVPFGIGNLRDFCRDLGPLLALHARRNPEITAHLAPVIDICASGISMAERRAQQTAPRPSALCLAVKNG